MKYFFLAIVSLCFTTQLFCQTFKEYKGAKKYNNRISIGASVHAKESVYALIFIGYDRFIGTHHGFFLEFGKIDNNSNYYSVGYKFRYIENPSIEYGIGAALVPGEIFYPIRAKILKRFSFVSIGADFHIGIWDIGTGINVGLHF